MLQKYLGVVLHTLKYNDKQNIVHIYTGQGGRMSFLVPAQRSRKSMVRHVLFQPLSLVEFESEVRPRSSLYSIKEARAWYLFQSIPYNPYKSAIAMFIAEFLYRVLKEEAENEALFAYLTNSIQWLDTCDGSFSNFHLVFLMRLSRFLGLYPNLEGYTEGAFFDLLNACFVPSQPLHGMFVVPQDAAHIRNLMRMNYDTMHLFVMNRMERNRCLDIIGRYYCLHVPDFPELRSLPILQELF